MVGLSIVLESQKGGFCRETPQVINKTTMILNHKTSSSPSSSVCLNSQNSFPQETTFLDKCFLCRKRLLPGKDIYMYKGDRAFCSVECRCKQIFMDEEESNHKENCSFADMRHTSSNSSSSSSSSPLKGPHHQRKGARNRTAGGGGFAY